MHACYWCLADSINTTAEEHSKSFLHFNVFLWSDSFLHGVTAQRKRSISCPVTGIYIMEVLYGSRMKA